MFLESYTIKRFKNVVPEKYKIYFKDHGPIEANYSEKGFWINNNGIYIGDGITMSFSDTTGHYMGTIDALEIINDNTTPGLYRLFLEDDGEIIARKKFRDSSFYCPKTDRIIGTGCIICFDGNLKGPRIKVISEIFIGE